MYENIFLFIYFWTVLLTVMTIFLTLCMFSHCSKTVRSIVLCYGTSLDQKLLKSIVENLKVRWGYNSCPLALIIVTFSTPTGYFWLSSKTTLRPLSLKMLWRVLRVKLRRKKACKFPNLWWNMFHKFHKFHKFYQESIFR